MVSYGGKYKISAPLFLICAATSGFLWADRLSMITISFGRKVGQSTWAIYSENIARSIGPSTTIHSVLPSKRIDESRVRVFQCPQGDFAWHREPRRERPRKRAMLVFALDSSRKTSRSTGAVFWNSAHFSLLWTMSSRSCSDAFRVFFVAKTNSLQFPMHRHQRAIFWKSFSYFFQCEVRLGIDHDGETLYFRNGKSPGHVTANLWFKLPDTSIFANPSDNSCPMKSQNISQLLLGRFASQVCLYRYFTNLRTCYAHVQNIENYLVEPEKVLHKHWKSRFTFLGHGCTKRKKSKKQPGCHSI